MRLKHLLVSSFRNIEMIRVEPGKRFNLLYGFNGQGKTNLLEAIYLLGNPRSFRNSRLPEFIRHGQHTGAGMRRSGILRYGQPDPPVA